MLQVSIYAPTAYTDELTAILTDDPFVSALAVNRGASMKPQGDVITADVAREAANDLIDRVRATGVHREGSVHISKVPTWISQAGFDADTAAPGESADSVVWTETVQTAYEETSITWSFITFFVLATMLCAIAIILDSQILIIGGMVLGPEFVAVAALGLALVRRRYRLLRRAIWALLLGFAVSITVTTLVTLVGRWLGWVNDESFASPRPGTDFIYTPDKWSVVVALMAGIAGVLALTSSRAGGMIGTFISVTTIPASANMAVALALWPSFPDALIGSTVQLVINIVFMGLAGWLTLLIQKHVWFRVTHRFAARRAGQRHPS